MMTEREKEQEFNEWLESIEFVDENNISLPAVLTEDGSDDPEGDRGE
jgi:hypothetical protein